MKTTQPYVQKLIDFLEDNLCNSNNFNKLAPRSFFFSDERDTVFVHVTDTDLIIINDGHYTIDRREMIPIYYPHLEDQTTEYLNTQYLQPILHKF